MAQVQREAKLDPNDPDKSVAITNDLFHLILHAVVAISDEKILELDAAYPADNDEALTPERVAAARESFLRRFIGEMQAHGYIPKPII